MDHLDVLSNPICLELTDNRPNELLLWSAATLSHAPAGGHILKELSIVFCMNPKVLEREFWPRWHLDVGDLSFEKDLFLASDYILEEAERTVLLAGNVTVLIQISDMVKWMSLTNTPET